MLSNILNQIKNIDKTQFVNVVITKLLYTEFFNKVDFLNIGLINGSEQDIYDVKNTFKYIKIFDKDMIKKYFQVFITDDLKFAKYIINNNYIKYLIYMKNEDQKFLDFTLSQNASTDKYKVFINTKTVNEKFNDIRYIPTKSIDLVPENDNVNIIIPTFNNSSFTIKCLKTIQKYPTNNYNVNIIIVDNGSTEESVLAVEDFCNTKSTINTILLKEQKNIGYTNAINLGIKYSLENFPASYTILLHNDMEASPNWIDLLLAEIHDNTVGTIPVSSDPDADQGFNKLRESNYVPNFPASFYRLKTIETADLLYKQYKDVAIQVDPSKFRMKSFCVALNTLLFEKIGMFDPIFEDGLSSDDDFFARIYLNGYNIKIVPAVAVRHNEGTTYRIWDNNWVEILKLKAARLLQYKLVNSLNIAKNKNLVVYTYKFNNDDPLPKLSDINIDYCDYICFTLDNNIKVPYPWLPINVKKLYNLLKLEKFDETIFKLWLKTHPHFIFRNYLYSVYLDNNIQMIINPYDIITMCISKHIEILAFRNDDITSIKNLVNTYKLLGTDKVDRIDKTVKYLENHNCNTNIFYKTNILIRRHNDKECIQAMNLWWNLISKLSKCDIILFSYIIELTKIKILSISSKVMNKYFQ